MNLDDANETLISQENSWKDWFKKFEFYVVAMIYMFSRVSLNVTATVMPLYLT